MRQFSVPIKSARAKTGADHLGYGSGKHAARVLATDKNVRHHVRMPNSPLLRGERRLRLSRRLRRQKGVRLRCWYGRRGSYDESNKRSGNSPILVLISANAGQLKFCRLRSQKSRSAMNEHQNVVSESSSIVNQCMCGGKMRLRTLEPHVLVDHQVDVWVFACTECLHEVRLIRPRDAKF